MPKTTPTTSFACEIPVRESFSQIKFSRWLLCPPKFPAIDLYGNSHAAIQCPPIPAIPNGVIIYAPDNTPNYDLTTVATYACNTGFALDLSIGGSVTRTCVDDWIMLQRECSIDRDQDVSVTKRLIAACMLRAFILVNWYSHNYACSHSVSPYTGHSQWSHHLRSRQHT